MDKKFINWDNLEYILSQLQQYLINHKSLDEHLDVLWAAREKVTDDIKFDSDGYSQRDYEQSEYKSIASINGKLKELANMVNSGYTKEEINGFIKSIEDDIDSLNDSYETLNNLYGALNNSYKALDDSYKALDDSYKALNDKIDNLGPGVDETRLVNIENTLSSIEVALKELSTYKENTL